MHLEKSKCSYFDSSFLKVSCFRKYVTSNSRETLGLKQIWTARTLEGGVEILGVQGQPHIQEFGDNLFYMSHGESGLVVHTCYLNIWETQAGGETQAWQQSVLHSKIPGQPWLHCQMLSLEKKLSTRRCVAALKANVNNLRFLHTDVPLNLLRQNSQNKFVFIFRDFSSQRFWRTNFIQSILQHCGWGGLFGELRETM